MKINLTLPFDRFQMGDEFLDYEAVVAMSRLAERTGYHAGLVTDHPCPTGRWLDAGGHHAQDPFVLLSFVGAATTTLRLQTGILVLPYRNPFITARSVATLDLLSRGRVRLGVGTGYLKGEYRALGVDFERRNELMDEYIQALKTAWTSSEFTFSGSGYEALGNRIHPLPVQKPHPPILIGGNAKRAIRRAAELGDAWNPFPTVNATLAATSRTVELTTEADLQDSIDYLRSHCETIGRAEPPPVELAGWTDAATPLSTQEMIDKIGRYATMGVSALGVHFPGESRSEWSDQVERFADEVVARLDGGQDPAVS
ncbi:LLM class F420-dependent oxidoreductase [Sphingomonas sp. BIUV-7]|uniref:LLM class F420-dependent oxidoreductase n=1 Tax=Sphingomonas natans TaxID=3063330 RepID=A0ABT8Y830_9SPHN|nr:LLM class F420-dependent oxidoreductase [Sphingomonas sp. BIUV-7]MDO6414475.1 LLM class F420-dependent oxidoreductase [Sphingomonas sp. BIUV-7]